MSWRNIPIPETIVLPLAIGVALEAFLPRALFPLSSLSMILMVVFFLLGATLIVWSVRTVGLADMALPEILIEDGPYAYTRNPMYLAWFAIYMSVFLLDPSLWLALLFPIAFLLTHFYAILPEENRLKHKFARRYNQYCKKVRRYL